MKIAVAALVFARACIPPGGLTDPDEDWLSNADERALGTDPRAADTDADGLDDNTELSLGTDPLHPDTDGDALLDGEELPFGRHPLVPDGPGGALWSWLERESQWRARGEAPFASLTWWPEGRGVATLAPDTVAVPAFTCTGSGVVLLCLEAGAMSMDAASGQLHGERWWLDADLAPTDTAILRVSLSRERLPDGLTEAWVFTAVPMQSAGQ